MGEDHINDKKESQSSLFELIGIPFFLFRFTLLDGTPGTIYFFIAI